MGDDNMTGTKDAGLDFNFPGVKKSDNKNPIIKVVGVGGGGCNAVGYMYRQGIHDVSYLVCNTDAKSLNASPVPNKLQFGDGLGAGNNPKVGREKAEASIDEIRSMLNDGTKMVFITAGMGGGTGTGAGPVVAKCAKEAGILTVGIVTIPFVFEGEAKIDQALDGVEEIAKQVDALLVINNERLREIYPDLSFISGFAKADDTLCVAARSIAGIISMRGVINLDFEDVKMVLCKGGVAVMSTAEADGERRVTHAIESALNSPLLNNNDIFNSKKVLLKICFPEGEHAGEADGATGEQKDSAVVPLKMEEMNEVTDFMGRFGKKVEAKFGIETDPNLGKKVRITLLASGFRLKSPDEGMDARDDAAQSQDEYDEQRKSRRDMYYPSNGSRPRRRHRFNCHIFTDSDLCNDAVIDMVADLPTHNRTQEDLKRIAGCRDTQE